jgi:hypothetical protein
MLSLDLFAIFLSAKVFTTAVNTELGAMVALLVR